MDPPRTVGELAAFLGGEVVGDPGTAIRGAAAIEEAGPGDVTFALDERFLARAEASEAAAVIAPPALSSDRKTLVRVENPRFAFAQALHLFAPPAPRPPPGIHPTAVVAPDAVLGAEVAVGAHAVVEAGAVLGDGAVVHAGAHVGAGARVGPHSEIGPRAVLCHRVEVGASCVIGPGTVIGSDGFGFVERDGVHHKIPQVGTVVIEDDVEIGALCAIDRAVTGETRIGAGTKMDNLVHVGHNVRIGRRCLVVAQVGISGSVTVGDRVVLAGQTGVGGHLTIGDGAVVAAKSGVTKSIPPGQYVSGFPARPHTEEKKIKVSMGRLPETVRRVGHLMRAVQRLARRIERLEATSREPV